VTGHLHAGSLGDRDDPPQHVRSPLVDLVPAELADVIALGLIVLGQVKRRL
jgi:hypothetical protein